MLRTTFGHLPPRSMSHLLLKHYQQIKGNDVYNNMQAKLLPLYTHTRPLGWDQKVKTFFSEYGHVTYQIKGNETCDKKQTNILPLRIISAPWVRSKYQNIFLNVVMLQKGWSCIYHGHLYHGLVGGRGFL